MNEIMRLENIHMSFKNRGQNLHVLKNINLSIHSGEIIALVGESGCGKTTLGRIMTGLIKPKKGNVYYQGNNVNRFGTDKNNYIKDVQFIQQDSYAALNPVKTIMQSLRAPLKAHNSEFTKEQIEVKIDEIMGMVGLSPTNLYLDKFPHQLSGGQRQRVLMARALTMNPKLIVADEPVSMIDVSMRLSILNLMKELNERLEIAFIYITHDLATARYIADGGKIAVMYLGEIVELGSIGETLKNPKHPYTRALIKAVPLPDVNLRGFQDIPIKSMDLMDLTARKDGCAFYERCIFATPRCMENPILYEEINASYVKCINLKEVLKDG